MVQVGILESMAEQEHRKDLVNSRLRLVMGTGSCHKVTPMHIET